MSASSWHNSVRTDSQYISWHAIGARYPEGGVAGIVTALTMDVIGHEGSAYSALRRGLESRQCE